MRKHLLLPTSLLAFFSAYASGPNQDMPELNIEKAQFPLIASLSPNTNLAAAGADQPPISLAPQPQLSQETPIAQSTLSPQGMEILNKFSKCWHPNPDFPKCLMLDVKELNRAFLPYMHSEEAGGLMRTELLKASQAGQEDAQQTLFSRLERDYYDEALNVLAMGLSQSNLWAFEKLKQQGPSLESTKPDHARGLYQLAANRNHAFFVERYERIIGFQTLFKPSAITKRNPRIKDLEREVENLLALCQQYQYSVPLFHYGRLLIQNAFITLGHQCLAKALDLQGMPSTEDLIFFQEMGESRDFQAISLAAAFGNAYAKRGLGLLYFQGIPQLNMEPNQELAAYWFYQAARQNNALAQYDLGLCFIGGQGVERNDALGVHWYQLAATQGLELACCSLANCYRQGLGTPKNIHKAIEILEPLAQRGCLQACDELGKLYLGLATHDFNDSIPIDSTLMEKALYYLNRVADHNNAEALYTLAGLYVGSPYGCHFIPSNFEIAAKYYEKAAQLGHGQAANNLGLLYEHGKGVEQNIKRAFRYFSKAAQLGIPQGRYNLAKLQYEDMVSKNKPDTHSIASLKQDMQHLLDKVTYPPALYLLGLLYKLEHASSPDHGPQLLEHARDCFLEAAYRGHGPSMMQIGILLLEEKRDDSPREEYQQVYHWLKAAQLAGEELGEKYIKFLDSMNVPSVEMPQDQTTPAEDLEALYQETSHTIVKAVASPLSIIDCLSLASQKEKEVASQTDEPAGPAPIESQAEEQKILDHSELHFPQYVWEADAAPQEKKEASEEDQPEPPLVESFDERYWLKFPSQKLRSAKELGERLAFVHKSLDGSSPRKESIHDPERLDIISRILSPIKTAALSFNDQDLVYLFKDPYFKGKAQVIQTTEKLKVVCFQEEKLFMANLHKKHTKDYDGVHRKFIDAIRHILHLFDIKAS
jgi:TPR repeat protein